MYWTRKVKRRGGYGSDVQGFRILDRDFRSHVFRRRYVYSVLAFLWTNGFFLAIELFETIRTHVYLHLRSILNGFLCRIYLLHNVFNGTRGRTLKHQKLHSKKAMDYSTAFFVSSNRSVSTVPISFPWTITWNALLIPPGNTRFRIALFSLLLSENGFES
jgi:hypothetical protein